LIEYTPPEAFLRLEHVKAKRTLRQVIDYNREYSGQYNAALENIGWLAAGMTFTAKKQTELEVVIPANSLYIIKIDNRKQIGQCTAYLSRNTTLVIELARDDDIYQIILGSGGPSDQEWHSGGDGFDFSIQNASGGYDGGFDF
jgi:hypothetical protein